jgi:phosphotransferase system enzyme I (PtsI)
LGFRAIRISLERKDIFRTQLRALLRAGAYGNLRIMYPMVGNIEELDEANKILDEERFKLEKEGIDYGRDIQVGIMVETPAAALLSDKFAKKVDFFSIGTNDLTQYTLAVDRTNKKVEELYDPFHPAVLRLINLVIENGHKNNIWVGMCGEMAGDQNAVPLLIGMGIDELSMNPKTIPVTRRLISKLRQKEWAEMVYEIFDMESSYQVREFTRKNLELV